MQRLSTRKSEKKELHCHLCSKEGTPSQNVRGGVEGQAGGNSRVAGALRRLGWENPEGRSRRRGMKKSLDRKPKQSNLNYSGTAPTKHPKRTTEIEPGNGL